MKTVFFLDDSQEFLYLMKLFVEKNCNCQTITTTSYQDTLSHEASILNSDLAFLDINLGFSDKSGLDVYRWLKQKGYQKPIYFLTGHAKDSIEANEAAALSGALVINKPIAPNELKKMIELHL